MDWTTGSFNVQGGASHCLPRLSLPSSRQPSQPASPLSPLSPLSRPDSSKPPPEAGGRQINPPTRARAEVAGHHPLYAVKYIHYRTRRVHMSVSQLHSFQWQCNFQPSQYHHRRYDFIPIDWISQEYPCTLSPSSDVLETDIPTTAIMV